MGAGEQGWSGTGWEVGELKEALTNINSRFMSKTKWKIRKIIEKKKKEKKNGTWRGNRQKKAKKKKRRLKKEKKKKRKKRKITK